MSVELDDRIRAMVRRLDEMAPMAPEFEALHPPAPSHRSRRVLIPVLIGAVALLAVALVQVGGRPRTSSSGAQLVPHSVADDLPDGWTVRAAGENTAPAGPVGMPFAVAYATADAPFGPVVALFAQMSSMLDTGLPTVERTRPGGLRTVIGATFGGHARWVDVEVSPGSWVGFAAAQLTDDELFQLAEQLVVDDSTGHFEGTLPRGLTLASSTFQFFGSYIGYGPDAAPASWPGGLTMTTYGPSDRPADTSISIFPANADTRVTLGLSRDLTDLGNETIAAETADDPAAYVYAERDGYGVWARSTSLDPEPLSRLVLSLRPASDAEWASLVSSAPLAAPDGSVSVETTAAEAPTDTEAERPDGAERSTVNLDYTPIENGTMTSSLPGGHPVTVQLDAIGRQLRVTVSVDNAPVYADAVDVNDTGGGGGNIFGDGTSLHVIIYSTAEPTVARLSAVDGVTEYTAPYVSFDQSSSVRIAIVVVPARSERTTPLVIRNLDANGSNLGNI